KIEKGIAACVIQCFFIITAQYFNFSQGLAYRKNIFFVANCRSLVATHWYVKFIFTVNPVKSVETSPIEKNKQSGLSALSFFSCIVKFSFGIIVFLFLFIFTFQSVKLVLPGLKN